MALIPGTRYPAQTDTDTGYPQGKARNAGSFQDGTGTPLERDWVNDLWGFLQSLLSSAAITPSGDPDEVGASQYFEATETLCITPAALEKKRNLTRALNLQTLDLNGTTPSENSDYLGVCSAGPEVLIVKGGTNGAYRVADTSLVSNDSVTAPSFLNCAKVVYNGSRHLAIGASAGPNTNVYSVTNGSTWVAGGATGANSPTDCVWDGTDFVMSTDYGQAVRSTNGVAWAAATGGSDIQDAMPTMDKSSGLAVLTGGIVVASAQDAAGLALFAKSTNHGLTWAATGGTIPTPSDYLGGYLAGNGGTTIYWLGLKTTLNRLDLFVSTDGTTWTKRSEITVAARGVNPDTDPMPKLCMCQDTGLLVAVVLRAGYANMYLSAVAVSVDLGLTWSDTVTHNVNRTGFGVARGRLFATQGVRLLASAPILL